MYVLGNAVAAAISSVSLDNIVVQQCLRLSATGIQGFIYPVGLHPSFVNAITERLSRSFSVPV